jgi:hypothetical protein
VWRDSRSETREGPKGSDIFVSHLYRAGDRWRMRIFAFVPHDSNEANRRIRTLLADAEQLKPKVAAAMGLNQDTVIVVDPYPSTVAALLGGQETRA